MLVSLLLFELARAQAPTRIDPVLTTGKVVGQQSVEAIGDARVRAEYAYNDRDHGDHIVATWSLDVNGIPIAYEAHGNDYMKAPIDERFAIENGHATWKDSHRSGQQAIAGAAFYMPANPPPEFYGVLARALLKAKNHRLALLPEGTATIDAASSARVDTRGDLPGWSQYRIGGIDFMPISVWLGRDGATTAFASVWLSTVAAGHEGALLQVLDAQDEENRAWFARLAANLTHAPKGDLIIRDARLFDPRDLTTTAHCSVLVRGERVARVVCGSELNAGADAEIIEARGRFLMPGLWDNHQHFDGVDGMLDIANGVTSARDMANDTGVFLKRVARFDAGTEIGPRVLKVGIIDGIGPNSVPLPMLVDTAEQAIKDVDWYADHGYVQIKTYMSLKPELVPIIAERAHARGLRVSGHVPAFMSAEQFIEAGADEIQHFNYVELDLLYPQVKETTRMSERFIKVAEHAREFTPDKPEVRRLIAFLKRHHTVLDPTMGLLEARMSGSPTEVTPGLRSVAQRFPPQVRRSLTGGTYEPPRGHEEAYRQAIPSMLELLKALHDAGVTIVPGTDAMAGYMLHHELELYVRAGIPAPEVLRMATLTSAEVMGVDKDVGVVAAGKLADMILIDGDPAARIGDIRAVSAVIKGGKVYDPAAIERALGMAAR
jgi:imidazolonepropionase-like amidohydrolase